MDVFNEMRTTQAVAYWHCAESLLKQLGAKTAIAVVQEKVGFGLVSAEAELLIHHIQALQAEERKK